MTMKRPAGLSDVEWEETKWRNRDARELRAIASRLAGVATLIGASALPRSEAYFELYDARHALGKVVARYGEGVPKRPHEEL